MSFHTAWTQCRHSDALDVTHLRPTAVLAVRWPHSHQLSGSYAEREREPLLEGASVQAIPLRVSLSVGISCACRITCGICSGGGPDNKRGQAVDPRGGGRPQTQGQL